MPNREAVRSLFEREGRFLQALEDADLDRDAAERVADVRDAYLDGQIDEQELEQRLEGAVANDNRSELSDRDPSVLQFISAISAGWFALLISSFSDAEIESKEIRCNQWSIRDVERKSPAEAAGVWKSVFSISPQIFSLMLTATGVASLPTLGGGAIPMLLCAGVFAFAGLASAGPEVRVHSPGRGDHVAD